MKKVFILFIGLILMEFACETETCKTSRFFNVTGMQVIPKATIRLTNGQVFDKSVREGDSLHLDQYYLDGYLNAEYYSQNTGSGFSFMPRAYATDCVNPGYDGSEEQVKNISLISMGYYSKTIQPGDTMKNAFLINDKPASEYISKNSQKIKDQYFTISLTKGPDSTNYQAFKVVYQLTNGETYEYFTPTVKFY
jgi:hypothetical protein